MIDFGGFVQTEGQPIYLQIMRYIKQGLAAGTIADGEELPSRRALSADHSEGVPPAGGGGTGAVPRRG